ncbi:hypothetical protein BDZ45DRAFT_744664 [Acephala macrosclerotiorum]|nr:hypothetical protein BDZ45DRAFT_744664 [Acephala macrosclerotiorum]
MKLQTYMLADLCIHISSLLSEVGNFLQRTFKLGSCVRNSLGPRTSAIRPRLTSNTVIEMIKISIDVWINACFLCQTGVHRVVPDMEFLELTPGWSTNSAAVGEVYVETPESAHEDDDEATSRYGTFGIDIEVMHDEDVVMSATTRVTSCRAAFTQMAMKRYYDKKHKAIFFEGTNIRSRGPRRPGSHASHRHQQNQEPRISTSSRLMMSSIERLYEIRRWLGGW